ncbi:hypothetical protein QBC47DRAFT_368838 [Echria macrotheca]|uniref:Uncharacterized protein n=1 Tax=Echria macrotheca TaxID=438768 RepID=A0AAJ0BMI0_9PEZI|nr:hypothetical protein QBC47DRAFT_368838 [Echria macrotheca]
MPLGAFFLPTFTPNPTSRIFSPLLSLAELAKRSRKGSSRSSLIRGRSEFAFLRYYLPGYHCSKQKTATRELTPPRQLEHKHKSHLYLTQAIRLYTKERTETMRRLISTLLRRPRRPPSPPNLSTTTRTTTTTLPKPRRRHLSSSPNPQPPQPQPTSSASSERASKILSRLPPSLQKYTHRLRTAPLSHILAFLVLHELTAIVPLVSLFALFHYTTLSSPALGVVERYLSGYIAEGAARFERYFKRRGWFGFSSSPSSSSQDEGGEVGKKGEKYRVVVEVAVAYAITKALLPLRIVGSLWATPWFAGVMGRVRRVLINLRRGK